MKPEDNILIHIAILFEENAENMECGIITIVRVGVKQNHQHDHSSHSTHCDFRVVL